MKYFLKKKKKKKKKKPAWELTTAADVRTGAWVFRALGKMCVTVLADCLHN